MYVRERDPMQKTRDGTGPPSAKPPAPLAPRAKSTPSTPHKHSLAPRIPPESAFPHAKPAKKPGNGNGTKYQYASSEA